MAIQKPLRAPSVKLFRGDVIEFKCIDDKDVLVGTIQNYNDTTIQIEDSIYPLRSIHWIQLSKHPGYKLLRTSGKLMGIGGLGFLLTDNVNSLINDQEFSQGSSLYLSCLSTAAVGLTIIWSIPKKVILGTRWKLKYYESDPNFGLR